MAGLTPAELANLLDGGLDPQQISYLCFTRWRFRRGELNEGVSLPGQVRMRAASLPAGRHSSVQFDRLSA